MENKAGNSSSKKIQLVEDLRTELLRLNTTPLLFMREPDL